LLANVSGPVNSLSVLLNTRVRKGQDLQVKGSFGIDGSPNPTYYFASRENYDAGVRTMDIRDEDNNAVFVLAKAGTEIIGNPVSTQAELNISPGEIAFGVDAEYAQISLGLTSAVILAGSPITTIPIDKLRSNLFSGTQVVLSSWQGSQRVILNGDATASESPVNLSVNTFTPDFDYNVGSEVFEPSFSQSSRITVNSSSIVLKVDTNGNIAAISLLGNPDLGSNITIQADQITVAGQTTFLSALSDEGFPTTTDVNVTIRSGTAPTERPDTTPLLAGDIWINTGTGQGNLPHSYDGTTPYNVNGWIRMYTVIDGGDLTTGSITANKIQAGAITANEIASATITGDKLVAGTITATQIATDTITATQIASGTITATEIASGTITGDRMVAGTITATQLGAGSVTANKINVDGTISLSAGGIIKSTSFTTGSAGWQIESDGSAEFNNVTVRGSLQTSTIDGDIEISSGGQVAGGATSSRYVLDETGLKLGVPGTFEGFLTARELDFDSDPSSDANTPRVTIKGEDISARYGNMRFRWLATDGNNATLQLLDGVDPRITLNNSGSAVFKGSISTTVTTDSTSKDTGSIITEGGVGIEKNLYVGGATINFANLPTSSAGLAAGDLWNDSGTLKIA
jgi:hypothetical protein